MVSTSPSAATADAERVIRLVSSLRFSLAREKQLQDDLEHALSEAGIPGIAEYRLSPDDCVDFFLPSGLAIECKLRAGRRQIYRQLCRYAAHAEVAAVLLVTNTAMGLPETIDDKPAFYASLGSAWL